MSAEFNESITYISNDFLNTAASAYTYLVPVSSLEGKRLISDIVVSIFADVPCMYAVTVVPEGMTPSNIIPMPMPTGWTFPTSNLAAGIAGVIPIIVKIPGTIQINSKDRIAFRIATLGGTVQCKVVTTLHIELD